MEGVRSRAWRSLGTMQVVCGFIGDKWFPVHSSLAREGGMMSSAGRNMY